MQAKLKAILITVALLASITVFGGPSWSDVTGRPHDLSLDNPRGHCLNCHDLHQTGLGEGYEHNLKRANEVAVCYQCHAGSFNDYTSIDPSAPSVSELVSGYDIRAEFEQTHSHFELYGMDGEHNKCSHCHNPHGVFDPTSTTRLPKLLSAGPDVVTDTDEYCFVCHNSDAGAPHLPFVNISVGADKKFSRDIYGQMTHSTFFRYSTLNEPVPDTAMTYDDNPYGAGKDISCLTCHRPHGSPNDHMLRSPDDETFCLSCHDGTQAADLSEFDVSGHGKPGVGRICQECHFPHGTGQENAVKTSIDDPHTGAATPADVNGSGMNAACLACHGGTATGVYSNAFPSSVSGWNNSGVTTTWDSTRGHAAAGCLKQVNTYSYEYYSYTWPYLAVLPNTQYKLSGYVYLPQTLTGNGSRLRIVEYNSSNQTITSWYSSGTTDTGGMWLYKTVTFTTSANTATVAINLTIYPAGTAYWDDIVLEKVPYDGGYFTGPSGYAASIHNTSPNAHNPADTAGDQQPGECDNCHDPHGRGYDGMLRAQEEGVCYDCHNSSTPNTQSGDDVEAAFQMASHHDLASVGCKNCHNVHMVTQAVVKMDPYNPAATLSDVNTFCLYCHSGIMPAGVTGAQPVSGQWMAGGHSKTGTLYCNDCHEPHGSPNPSNLRYRPLSYGGKTASFTTFLNFTSRPFCESCHSRSGLGYKDAAMIPSGAGYVSEHGSGDSTPCSECHRLEHNPRLADYTGARTFYVLACLECHTQGEGNPYPDADAEFNTPANAADADTMRSTHAIKYKPYSTVPAVDCTVCHGADHEADHNASARVADPDPFNGYSGTMPPFGSSNVFCLECHDSTPVSIGGYSPVNIMSAYTSSGHGTAEAGLLCADCHMHHGSAKEKLIRDVINGKTVLDTYSGNNVTVCTACHQGMDPALPKWPGFGVYSGSIHAFGNPTTGNPVTDGRHGAGACVNCHNPHGQKVAGEDTHSMARKDQENLCYTCHASGFDNFSTPGDYNNKWNLFGYGVMDVNKQGGALRVGRTVIPSGKPVFDGVETSYPIPDKDALISVRLKLAEFTRDDGSGIVGLMITDSKSVSLMHLSYRADWSPRKWIAWSPQGYYAIDLFGDESSSYHTLKIVRNESAGTMDAYVDDTFVGTFSIASKGFIKARLFVYILNNNNANTEAVDAYFDDFKVEYTYDGSAHNTASRDDVQDRFYMKSHHDVSDEDQLGKDGLPGTADDSKIECEDCHDPHTVTAELMAFRQVSGVVVPIEADQEFCLKCHDGDPPAGVVFPEEGVWDKSDYDSSAHGNPLKRNRTFGNYSNGVVYACKVCHNPHGSDQAALQRESWDIDRDGIPDDIDGDGLLDSSTLVGFIGYSTGTRKVILVDSPREGFQRISSTIPYQENGSIDVELCFNCHDGTPAPDVESDFSKVSHHDVTYEEQQASGGSRIECYHCHDQHRAQARDDSAGEYATTNPDPPREPMPGDAKFCLGCHDNTLPAGVSFGAVQPKNIKLSYNPYDLRDANGYDLITSYRGHYVQSDGTALMCRECHNQHGSDYSKMLRDDTEQASPNHDPSQPIQEMQHIALRLADPFGGGDEVALSSTTERCLTCHSGVTTYNGQLLPLPPPPDSIERGFSMTPVGKHPELKAFVTSGDEVGGHIYNSAFALITTPGSIKEDCTLCHDSHNPYINTVSGQLMDCYQCHNENTSLPDTQSEFNDNPTNPTRSKSIHPIHYDPTGTDPSYVECLKCHDQSRHMQGVVRLRKDPSQFNNYTSDLEVWADSVVSRTINQFCLECHDPGTAVEANFTEGGTHVPPKLPAGYASGAHFSNGDLLCTDCHEYHGSVNNGLRKNEFGDEETFCFGCHSNPSKSENGVNIQDRFAQSSHHDVDTASQGASGSKVECEDCHNPHVVTRDNPVVSVDDRDTPAPSDDAFCIGCHDSGGASGVKFPGYTTGTGGPEWNTSTGAWNRWNKEAYSGSGHELQGVKCIKCHDPHGSPNYAMLLQNISSSSGVSVGFGLHSTARGERTEELGVNSACRACHKDATGVYGGYAPYTSLSFGHKNGIDKNCTYCHNPHGTSEPNLIRSSRPLNMDMSSAGFGSVYNFKGFANSTTGAPYYAFCSSRSCHGTEVRPGKDMFSMDCAPDTYMDSMTGSSHHPVKEGVMGCTSCHNEHGSANAPDLRAPYFRETGWPVLFKSGIGAYKTYRYPGRLYQNSYYPQFLGYSTNFFEMAKPGYWPDATQRNRVTTVNPPDDGNDLCYMCHVKDDIIGTAYDGMTGTSTKFLGHEAVEGGATVSHNISRNGDGLGSDYHNFTCSACHLPHSIGRPKLVKQGCFSQNDNKTPTFTQNYTGDTIGMCHAYNKWGGNWASYGGWRNLTTTAKTDFNRPADPVVLSYDLDADLTVHLNWDAVEDQPGQGAHHYNIYRYGQYLSQDVKPYATLMLKGLAGAAAGQQMTWTDYTGQPDTTYYYAVTACDAENNESFLSNCATVAIGPDITIPATIDDQVVVQSGGTYGTRLKWTDPGDNVNVTLYKVYRLDGSTPLTDGDIVPGNYVGQASDTSLSDDGSPDSNEYTFTDTTTQSGQTYSFAVVALDAAGNVSHVPTGTGFSITIDDDPAPGDVTTLAARPVSREMEVRLDWSAPVNLGSISGYYVYRKAGSAMTQGDLVEGNRISGPALVTDLFHNDSTVTATDTDYYYAVTAIDSSSGKESALGNSPSANIPAPPVGVGTLRHFDTMFSLWWSPPAYTTGFQSYNAYYRRESGSWSLVTNTTSTSASADLSELEPGTYNLGVTAVYSTYGGTTPYESVVAMSPEPDEDILDTFVPASFSAAASLVSPDNDYAKVDWTAPADNNFAGYSSVGVDYYWVESTYDRGATWDAVFDTRLPYPSFESLASGTVDDSSTDSFYGWWTSNTYAFAVSDCLFGSKAMKIRYDGSGDRFIYSPESNTGQALAYRTYYMSFWAKANKDATFEYFIQNGNGVHDEKPGLSTDVPVGPAWRRYTTYGQFGGTQDSTYARAVIRPSSDTTAEITIDGVKLEEGAANLLENDGSFYRPSGYNTPGSPLSLTDPKAPTPGTSDGFRVRAVDAEGNISATATTGYVNAKPTPITDLDVTSATATSGNILQFSPSSSLNGVQTYNIYAKEQATQLTTGDLATATLLDTLTPTSGPGNIAPSATVTASHVYSTSSSYAAVNATDGSTGTYWYGKAGVGPNWLELDFGHNLLLSDVSFEFFNNNYYRPQDYLVQTYDGVGWVTQNTVTGNSNNTPSYTYDPPVSTSKVRIYITRVYNSTTMPYGPRIYEFSATGVERYVHDLQNTALRAEVGHTYAYAVTVTDTVGLVSAISNGTTTVRQVADKDPPAKVTNLELTSPIGFTKVHMSWSTPLDNLGYGLGTGALGYKIYRLPTSSVGTPEPVTDDNFGSASLVYTGTYGSSEAGTFNTYSTTWYDHQGVYYAVSSSDASGNWSQVSNSPFIVVGKDVDAPTPPTITACIPVESPEVDVYWDAAVDNVGINGYRLFRANVDVEPFATDQCITENNVDQAEVAVSLIPYSADSQEDMGGTPGNTYYYALRAWDDENNLSNISNCVAATVKSDATDSTPPVWTNATSLTVDQQPYPDIDLFWNPATDEDDASGAGTIDHYDIYRSLTSFSSKNDPGVTKIATLSGVRHSYVDRTGNHETTYFYGVVAVDASATPNSSALSNVASATVAVAPSPDNTPPTLPTGLAAATGVYPYINLTWTPSTDEDDAANPLQLLYYKLYRADYPLDITDENKDNPDQVKTFIVANDADSYVTTGASDAMYNYRLEAFDLAGNSSGLSGQAVGTVASAPCVDVTAPTAPTNLAAVVGPSPDIDLSWTASSDSGGSCPGVVDHYQLYKADYEITSGTDLRTLTHIHVAGNSTSYVDSSGEPNKEYWYVLTAVDSSDNESDKSNIIVKTTAADTMAPAAIADLLAEPASGYALLTWCRPSDNVGVDHYEIYRKEQATILTDYDVLGTTNRIAVFTNAGICLSYHDDGALSGNTYSYAVIAVDLAGNRSTISRGEGVGDTIAEMP